MKAKAYLLFLGSGSNRAARQQATLWRKSLSASLVLVLVLASLSVFGQWKFGVIGGPSFTTFGGDEKKDWGQTDSDPKMVVRFHVGGVINYTLSDKMSLESGLKFATRGAKYSGDQGIEYNKTLTYLDLPLAIRYAISENFGITFGPQVSFLLSAKIKNSDEAQELYGLDATEDAKDFYNAVDAGILVAPYYSINENFAVRLEYLLGLTKIAHMEAYNPDNQMLEDKDFKVSNRGFMISLIYTLTQK